MKNKKHWSYFYAFTVRYNDRIHVFSYQKKKTAISKRKRYAIDFDVGVIESFYLRSPTKKKQPKGGAS